MNYISQKMYIGKPCEDIQIISHRSCKLVNLVCEDIQIISHRRCKLVNLVRIYKSFLTEVVNW